MKVERKRKAKIDTLFITTRDGREFIIKETELGKLKIGVPGGRIMYGTEEGNNNADYILLIK